MARIKWTEKYRPRSLDQVLGNKKAVTDLRGWARSWDAGLPKQRAVILHGPAGVGKTSAALALADELGWDYIEMNASDTRTASALDRIAGPASRMGTFSGARRLIILDEADNLHGNADRGGASAMLRLVKGATQPVVLIANEYYAMDRTLRDSCLGIQFRSIRATTVASTLRNICAQEGISCDPEALLKIADMAGGDLRSAVNDLQAASVGLDELRLEDVATSERDVKANIFKVLNTIFKGSDAAEAQRASYSLDESPEDLIHWIDENLPLAYKGEDLFRGFESLSRADVFLGRVRRRQNYGLWRYAGFFMTAGILASRTGQRGGYIAFKPPSLWRRLGQTRRARNVRDSAASKIGRHCHVGSAYARAELMGFVGMLLKNKEAAPRVAALLDLTADEISLLIGSKSTTKKVQNIFEEGQRLREEDRISEIELGWRAGPEEEGVSSPDLVEGWVTKREEERDAKSSSPDPGARAGVAAPETPLKTQGSKEGPEGPDLVLEEADEAAGEREPGRPGPRDGSAPASEVAKGEEAGGKKPNMQRSLFDF